VKSICEGYNTLPGSKLSVHPHDLTAASLSHSHMSATSALTGYDQTGGATESYAGEGGESQMQYGSHSYRQANSTPHQHHQPHNVGAAGGLLVPADFAASHPPSGYHHDSSSFLSLTTPAHSATDIVLEDADVST
jgi:anaphase-promoting complex subunit 3